MNDRTWSGRAWPALVAVIVLIIGAWDRLDFFRHSMLVPRADGSLVREPNALASVDHPFHAVRFAQFLHALGHGHAPRWIFSHQGGYPTEFYPFGSAIVDLVVWLITFGRMSIPMVHTWSVAIVFALPAIGFFGIARLAKLSPWIAVIATAGHLCVRGWWWSGGSYELIEWGLITNVLASVLVFIALVSFANILDGKSSRWIAIAGLLIGWAEVTNPRSALAVASIVVAGLVVWMISGSRQIKWWRLALPALLGIALAAPVLVPLIRYRDLYYFVNYSRYDHMIDWWHSSVTAVSTPFMVLAIAGLFLSLFGNGPSIERLLAWTFLIYIAGTLYLVEIDWPATWTEQLETTRLMPFQRLLMFSLAAIAIGRLLALLPDPTPMFAGAGLVLLTLILYIWAPPSFIPVSDRGLVRIGTMAEPGIVDLHEAVDVADESAAPNTAMLILGTTAYWHDHMWANLWTNRPLFYDDWLWYWQTQHVGDYDPLTEHAYTLDSSTIDPTYLSTHGIGSIVVTGQAKPYAETAPFLTRIRVGTYDVFLIKAATTMATLNGTDVASTIGDDQIRITGLDSGGALVVRENWFPRWHASANGKDIRVVHRSDGYMEVQVPAGTTSVTLTYRHTSVDWLAAVLSVLGALTALGLIVRAKPTDPSVPQESSAPIAQTQQ